MRFASPKGVEWDDEDVAFIFCPHHRRKHHHRQHLFMSIIVGYADQTTGEIHIMSDTSESVSAPLSVPPVPHNLALVPGPVVDAQGFLVTSDPLVSVDFTVDDTALVSAITPNSDGTLGAVMETTGAEGTVNISATGVTTSGLNVTSTDPFPVQIAAGPPATFAVEVTDQGAVTPPAPVPGA